MKSVNVIVVAFLPVFLNVVKCDLDKDLTLTWQEKIKLDKFRERVEAVLPHEYMKEDMYLIRWLRAKDFNLVAAENMLMSNLEWRKKERMDTIEDEDWSDMLAAYKYWDHSLDKQGQPVSWHPLGAWDVRRMALAGQSNRGMRYLSRNIQSSCYQPMRMRAEGFNVTQIDYIVDLSGFSITQTGCLACVPMYLHFVTVYETFFPGCAEHILLINTPAAFEPVLRAITPLFSKQTRDTLKIFGTNKNVWQPLLFKLIDKDQLPPEVGGSDQTYEDVGF